MSQTTITKALTLSTPELNMNIRTLARRCRDEMTGTVGTSLIASNAVVDGSELLFQNGALLTPSTDYTVDGFTITLDVAAIAADVFVLLYYFRGER